MDRIDSFKDEYAFLSNFYPCNIKFCGHIFSNSESIFQVLKSPHPEENLKLFSTLPPGEAKKLGRSLPLRKDWEAVKYIIMRMACRMKFEQNPILKQKLLETGTAELIEGNTWHDNCWGNCTCEKCKDIEGKNLLGNILMELREEFRNELYRANSSTSDIN